jgi:5-methylcytosine-specific restriction endonuclease McrA
VTKIRRASRKRRRKARRGVLRTTKNRVLHLEMRLTDLSNEELLSSLKSLVCEGNRILAKVIAYLAEVEDRRLHLELACSSMFDFCTRKLGFSEGESFRRLTAARLVRRFPVLLEAIASGRLHLSSVVRLRDLFSEENVDELVEAASGKTKREVEELIAKRAPKPDVAPSIRKLPDVSRPAAPQVALPAAPRSSPIPAGQVQPLSESRYKIQLTASAALKDKLEHARALMSHRNPSGDLAAVVEQALDLLIEKLEKEKLGKVACPRAAQPRPSSNPGHVTRTARREVIDRDGLQCSFVGKDGERCPARAFLELDHRHPRALGGTGEASNVRVRCRAHNRHAAEQVFGCAHIEERIHFRQRKSPPDAETRSLVRGALRAMGFRTPDTERALAAIEHGGGNARPDAWSRPVEALVREALGVLT